eukprot:CAMPEP_0168284280 /NCGR_PEP_ID=MMETSP0141_2-20121125/23419_1 /TAXON_ID=44445 /ORGANISM="Pseudo-nitzschia australis, Strain 10249 10 AB" /LENGTH=795 /DNA_ID=CAMNT_0008228267 /DNA_START=137 /DNA_END=2524 /DNA_ORIENTATION=+
MDTSFFDLKTSLYDDDVNFGSVEGNYVEDDVENDEYAKDYEYYAGGINHTENENEIVKKEIIEDEIFHDNANDLYLEDMDIAESDDTVGSPMDDGDEESVDNADINVNANANNTDSKINSNSNSNSNNDKLYNSNSNSNSNNDKLYRRSTLSTAASSHYSASHSHSHSHSQGLSDEVLDDALQDPFLMEKILGRELYEMKPEEREAATNELHGVEFESNKGVVGGMQQHHRGSNISNFTNAATSNAAYANNHHNDNDCAFDPSSLSSITRIPNETTKESPAKTAFFLAEMQDVLDELVPPSSVASNHDMNINSNINANQSPNHSNHHSNRRRQYHAYRRGLELNSDYIRTPEYRLRFLRADRFDARKAALRYCNCLNLLFKWFGATIFHRQLYLSDLTMLEQKYCRDGNVQVLPSRDRIGRRVLVFIGRHDASTPEEYAAAFRLLIYLIWTIPAQDVTTQVKGAVVLIFPTFEDSAVLAKHSAKKLNQILHTIPLRYSAIHFCIPNSPINNMVRSLCLLLIGPEGRRVCRVHTGSPVEVDYALSSYGIIIKDIPRTYTFMIKTKNWARFVKVRTAIDNFHKKSVPRDASTSTSAVDVDHHGHRQSSQSQSQSKEQRQQQICGVECPEVNCILFGNKAMAWDHPGNIEFRDLIEEKELERQTRPKTLSLKGDKYNDHIIDEGRLKNYVYMEYDKKNLWYTEITDDDVLRHKVTQLLTGIRKRRKATRMAQKMRADSCPSPSLSSSLSLSPDAETSCTNTNINTITKAGATTNPCGGFHSFVQNKELPVSNRFGGLN